MAAKSRKYKYEGSGGIVTYDLVRCIHAGECVKGLPEVFDSGKKPWIQPDKAHSSQLSEVILRCPSGALRIETETEPVASVNTVSVVADGPLYVRGRVLLDLGEDGLQEEKRLALCRCGASANKPLCDGSHKKTGFSDSAQIRESKLKEGEAEENSLRITPAKNGPFLLEGRMEIRAGDTTVSGGRTALCRCGASDNKPFCDGSHRKIGFKS